MIIWKNICGESWQGTIENGWEVSGKPGASLFFIPKGALTHHPQAGGGMAFGHRALSEGDCGSCGSRWTRLHLCQTASLAHAVGAGGSGLEAPVHGVVYCHLIPPPACVNLPPAAWHRYRGGTICSTPAGGTSYLTTYLLQSSTEEGLLRFTVALQKGR